MASDEYRKLRKAALSELTEYSFGRGWTIWTDGVSVVLTDPRLGREGAVNIYSQLMEQDATGGVRITPPHILAKRMARDKGWRKVKTIRRPGALTERGGKTRCSL